VFFVTANFWACSKEKDQPAVDSQTAATIIRPVAAGPNWRPPSDNYLVIGSVKGLKGTIVKYNKFLYRGGDIISADGVNALKAKKIKTVISITPTALEKKLCASAGISLVEFPYEHSGLLPEQLDQISMLLKKVQTPLYIHCHGGNHRAGVLCLLYRQLIEHWGYNKALVEFGQLGGNLMRDYNLYSSARL